MRLDKDNCLGGRLDKKNILGIRINGYNIFPNVPSGTLIPPSGTFNPNGPYNIYLLSSTAPIDAKLEIDKSDRYFSIKNECLTDWGDGVIDDERRHYYYLNYDPNAYMCLVYTTRFLLGSPVINKVLDLRPDIINAGNMYAGYKNVKSKDLLLPEDTLNIESMGGMFNSCDSLTYLYLDHFDTSNVVNMASMFANCNNLAIISGLEYFNTKKVLSMYSMFANCESLSSLDLSRWDTRSLGTGDALHMCRMFNYCTNLEYLDIRNFHISQSDYASYEEFAIRDKDHNYTTDLYAMFYGCDNLHTLRLDNCDWNTLYRIFSIEGFPTNKIEGVTRKIYCKEKNVTGITCPENWVFEFVPDEPIIVEPKLYEPYEFRDIIRLTDIRPIVILTHTSLDNMFNGCCDLVTIHGIDAWDTRNITDMNHMFTNCRNLLLPKINNFKTSNVINMASMFSGCSRLTELDLSSWDTGNVIDMNNMFYECWELIELDVSNFDTSNVTNMLQMFSGCKNLIKLDLSSWNTSKVTDMTNTFSNCYNLAELDVSNFDTSSVTDIFGVFNDCRSLTSLNVNDWDISNVTNMRYIFKGCNNLIKLDLSKWHTSHVEHMEKMFLGCNSLEELDIRNFDFDNIFSSHTVPVLGIEQMFDECYNLHTLRLDNCDNETIRIITSSTTFPTNKIEGKTRKIYCKRENAAGLAEPDGWKFVYID